VETKPLIVQLAPLWSFCKLASNCFRSHLIIEHVIEPDRLIDSSHKNVTLTTQNW